MTKHYLHEDLCYRDNVRRVLDHYCQRLDAMEEETVFLHGDLALRNILVSLRMNDGTFAVLSIRSCRESGAATESSGSLSRSTCGGRGCPRSGKPCSRGTARKSAWRTIGWRT
jgi:hypothetical protein